MINMQITDSTVLYFYQKSIAVFYKLFHILVVLFWTKSNFFYDTKMKIVCK